MTDPDKSQKPLLQHAAARVAHARAAADLSDYSAAIVPTSSDRLAEPGEFITQARQARKLALAMLQRAVLLERALGHSWKQIAHAFGYTEQYVRDEYAPLEEEWLSWLRGEKSADDSVTTRILNFNAKPISEVSIRRTAADLDAWCDQHRPMDHDSPAPGPRLVSDGLTG